MKKLDRSSKFICGIGLVGISVVGIGLTMPSTVQASDITFKLTWDGSYFGNTASAVGYFTIDSTVLPNPGNTPSSFSVPNIDLDPKNYITSDPKFNAKSPITDLIKSLSLTVTGSGLGDGTYTLDDYSGGGVIWNTNGANLDFSKDLVGQPTQGEVWGTIDSPPPGYTYPTNYTTPVSYGGDFNIFDAPGCVPTGVGEFTLATCSAIPPLDGKFRSFKMRLTSFEAVPVPLPSAMFGIIASGGFMAVSWKKKKVASTRLTKATD